LPVTNPAGTRSLLYGQRFNDGPISKSTPAIVLVHGIASSTENWDFSPTWSVARALASAGYLVFSYDRLGYAKSPYPKGGATLTTQAHRAMLHDVVHDVKTAGYRVTSSGRCTGTTTPGHTRNARVVVVGHSAGGWIVAGYPGEYHDVAAMIQNDISGSTGAGNPLPKAPGGNPTTDPHDPSYFQFFQTSKQCYQFNTYKPGLVAYVARIACRPPFLDSPYGELLDIGPMYAQNDVYISQIGPRIPVLLSSGAQDTTDPPNTANADAGYYRAHCGCHVTQIMLANTAHLFMVHRSLPTWVDDVVNWLDRHGLAAVRGSGPPFTG
jgi:pimeloyl-ACP methyl ester carboxylesterase